MKKESQFQHELKNEIKNRFPGCYILKNDPNCIQGFPDLLILYKNRWAALEVKRNEKASHQPNQDYYIEQLNDLSFASVIFPENKEEVLNAMEQSLSRRSRRSSRISRSE